MNKLTTDYLKIKVPNLELDVLQISTRNYHKMKMLDFIEKFYEQNQSDYYLVDWTFENDLHDLLNDYEIPNFFIHGSMRLIVN